MANSSNLRSGRLIWVVAGALLVTAIWFGVSPPTASVPGPGASVEVRESNEFEPYPMPTELAGVDLLRQPAELARTKSAGCVHCHQKVCDPHGKDTLHLGCTDCHGGDASTCDKAAAHVHPRFPDAWPSSANPVRSYTLLNHEKPEFIRFVNPGDLRVAHIGCGTVNCHPKVSCRSARA